MSLRFKNENFTIMEDYAHHPTELRASLTAFREIFPARRLVVLFQPHRYARLERYFAAFAAVLALADRVFVTPVFAAWTASGKYSSADLAAAIGVKATAVAGSWEEIAQEITGELQEGDLIAVIGAGDLKDVIEPLKKRMS
jgi:UDP-N-acetylmuramate--alanine ligase